MNERMNGDVLGASARRRLLRGAFAAPAVLTLYSGGAIAQASGQCALVNATAPAIVNHSRADSYLRYQLWGLERNRDSTKVDHYVQGSDLDGWIRAVGFAPRSGQWQKFDIEQKKLTGRVLNREPKESGCTFKRVQKYVVLRVDSSGAITCVGDGTGLLTTASCAASLGIGPATILRA